MSLVIFLAGILNLILIGLVWSRKRKSFIDHSFILLTFFITIWIFLNFLFQITFKLSIVRSFYAVGALVISSALLFSYSFVAKQVKIKKNILIIFPGFIFFILSYIDGLIISSVDVAYTTGYDARPGILFPFYGIFIVTSIIWILVLFYRHYKNFSSIQKSQARIILFGLISFGIVTSLVSFILPLLKIWSFTSLDSPSSLFFTISIAFAISRYRFMDIRAIIFRSIAFSFIVFLISSVFAAISSFIAKLFTDYVGIPSNMVAGVAVAILVTLFYLPARNVIERVTNTFLYKKSYNSELLQKKVNEMASSLLDLKTLNFSICGLLEDAFNCEKIGIALLNEKKKLRIAYQKGFLAGVPEMLISFPGVTRIMLKQFQETPGIFVIDERKTQYDNGEFMPVSPKMMNLLHENDLALIIPLYSKENLIGVLALGNKKSGEAYSTRDLNILNIMSGQIAVAIDRAQLYSHLEDLVEERTEELKTTNEKLEGANVQLKKLDASKSEFISIASHQLRSPLTAVKGYVSMMKEGDYGTIPPKQLRILDIVNTSNERLIALVNDLLNISRIESGKQKYDFKKGDLMKLAQEVVTQLLPQSEKKGLKLILEKPAQPFSQVVFDSERLHEVMVNFVDNAIKYSNKGTVTVTLKPEPLGMVTFSVKDSGMGISKETMPQLFKKFSRGEGSFLVQPGGSGLGLYVAKMVVEGVHEGKIWAESEGVGKGSTFIFSIPIDGPKKILKPVPEKSKVVEITTLVE